MLLSPEQEPDNVKVIYVAAPLRLLASTGMNANSSPTMQSCTADCSFVLHASHAGTPASRYQSRRQCGEAVLMEGEHMLQVASPAG